MRLLAKDCDFEAVTAELSQNDSIRDAFISGIISNSIRLRLLENRTLNLEEAFNQARSMEAAERNSNMYNLQHVASTSNQPVEEPIQLPVKESECLLAVKGKLQPHNHPTKLVTFVEGHITLGPTVQPSRLNVIRAEKLDIFHDNANLQTERKR